MKSLSPSYHCNYQDCISKSLKIIFTDVQKYFIFYPSIVFILHRFSLLPLFATHRKCIYQTIVLNYISKLKICVSRLKVKKVYIANAVVLRLIIFCQSNFSRKCVCQYLPPWLAHNLYSKNVLFCFSLTLLTVTLLTELVLVLLSTAVLPLPLVLVILLVVGFLLLVTTGLSWWLLPLAVLPLRANASSLTLAGFLGLAAVYSSLTLLLDGLLLSYMYKCPQYTSIKSISLQ